MNQEEEGNLEENSSESGWKLKLDSNPHDHIETFPTPANLFRKAKNEDHGFAFFKNGNAAHWQHLKQTVQGKIERNERFQFSLIDRLAFDWGIWCGEQFAPDPGVQEVLAENQDEKERHLYQLVYEEILDELGQKSIFSKELKSITTWLEDRAETYRIIGEAEQFTITPDIAYQLPEVAKDYLELRDQRLKYLTAMKPLFEKLPGMSPSMLSLLSSGTLHDELDFMNSAKMLDPESTRKLNKLQGYWTGVTQNLAKVFSNDKIQNLLLSLQTLSQQVKEYCSAHTTDVQKIRELARDAYQNEHQTLKRIGRDIQLLKNNMNVASMRKVKKPYHPFRTLWPEPLDPQRLIEAKKKHQELDAFYPSRAKILLAPGDFDGFFEFDRETLILPLFCAGEEELQLSKALVDYRVAMETHKESSDFLLDLQSEFPGNPRKSYESLYLKWCQQVDQVQDKICNEQERAFLLKHTALSPQNLFIKSELLTGDRQSKSTRIKELQAQASPENFHMIAALFYSEGLFKEAQDNITKAIKLKADEAIYEFCLGIILKKSGRDADGLKVLQRVKDRYPNSLAQLFIEEVLESQPA